MSDAAKWQLLVLSVLLGGVIYLLAPVLTPFAIAALFAYLCDPLVDRLERLGLSRSLAVSMVFVLFILFWLLVLLILAPMLERQMGRLVEQLPRWIGYLQEAILPRLEQYTGFSLQRLDPGALLEVLRQHWQQAGGLAQSVLGGLSRSGMALLVWVANLLLLPVLVFYLLRDWDLLVERVRELLPRAIEPTVSRLARQSDEVLGAFLRGQLSVMLALGAIYAAGLMLVGIDLGLLIGLLAGLVSFIPYLGAIVGVGAGVVAALVQHGDLLHVVLVLAVFGIGQLIESFLLTPWLVGDRIGLHPVAVIFAIMAGGQLFGFFGVLLALPAAAVAMVLLRYAHERYTASQLYGRPEAEVAAPARPVAGEGDEGEAAADAEAGPG
ncbi:MAG: AI-2E family transporter [Lysobacteraceae bacterium]|nr:MAG: AI-2E family transporter [Xanthomonadaceae bacterium]